jgi:hypothetical protein
MAAINFYGLTGTLAAAISPGSVIMQVDPALAGVLAAGMDDGDVTYLSLTAGNIYELVKVTDVEGVYVVIERAVYGTAQSFPLGTRIAFQLTAEAVMSQLDVPPTTVDISGTGQATVTEPSPNVFAIAVPTPTITGENGIEVLGTWPSIRIAAPATDCCGDESEDEASGIITLTGQGIATAYAVGTEGFINVPAPNFVGAGVTITGAWPDITFTVASGAGGTVTSVAAGPGLTITGSPTVAPVVNLNASGVAAGTYGGIVINVRGIIEAVPATLNPVSVVNFTAPIGVVRVADAITISVDDAAIGAKGVVELTDHTDPFDPLDTTTAMTPAAVQVALDTIIESDVTGADSYTSEADALYTNTISATATPIELAAGEKAIVFASATVTNNADVTIPHTYGIAVFNATPAKIKADKSVKQIQQSLTFMVTGPIGPTAFALVTTDLTGATLLSYGLHILKL